MEADGRVVHPLLQSRFSPTLYEQDHRLSWASVMVLLEAARWAPSAGNSQPWMFWPVLRGSAEHADLVPMLAPSARRWAPGASLLVLNIVRRYAEDPAWEYSEFSDYDLGQAVAHMTIQAQAMGLSCRQFRAFDLDRISARFELEQGWELRTITAIGRSVDAGPVRRERRALREIMPPPRRR